VFSSKRDADSVTIDLGEQTEQYVLRIKEPTPPSSIKLDRTEDNAAASVVASLLTWEAFDAAAEGWYYDAEANYLWVRFATEDAGAQLTYETLP
jgi:hypothetical protein